MKDKEILGLWEAYKQVHTHQEEVEQLDEISKRLASDVVLARIGQTGAAHNREMKNRTRENMMASQEAGRKEARAKRLAAGVRKRRNANEEFETWINALVEEGYDLSEYTWDDMYEIYMEEVEQLDEDAKYDRNRKRAAQRAAARNEARKQGKTGSVPGVGYVSPRAERETYRDSAGVERHKSGARMPQKEEIDLFDTILEHLVSEGYADTNESALAIMANMSEEWRQSIVEEVLDERNRGEQGMSDREVTRRRNLGGNVRSRVSASSLGDHGPQSAIQKFHKGKAKQRREIHKSGRGTRGDTGESGGQSRYQANKDHSDGYPSITKRGDGPY